jgi:hypothetical protein
VPAIDKDHDEGVGVVEKFLQQWTAAQAVRGAGLSASEVWLYYLGAGGSLDELEVEGYLTGLLPVPAGQRDLIADAINELLEVGGSPGMAPTTAPVRPRPSPASPITSGPW